MGKTYSGEQRRKQWAMGLGLAQSKTKLRGTLQFLTISQSCSVTANSIKQKEESGGREGARTPDPLLAKIGRTKNQQLAWSAMNCYLVLQVQHANGLDSDRL